MSEWEGLYLDRVQPMMKSIGFRIGITESDYYSGFAGFKAKLMRSRLVRIDAGSAWNEAFTPISNSRKRKVLKERGR